MAASRALAFIYFQVCICAVQAFNSIVKDDSVVIRQPNVELSSSSSSFPGPSSLQEQPRSSLVRRGLDVRIASSSIYSSLIASAIFACLTAVFACVAQLKFTQSAASKLGLHTSICKPLTNGDREPRPFAEHRLLLKLKEELPVHAPKATAQKDMTECDLPGFIHNHFERDASSMRELQEVLYKRHNGESPGSGWWSWTHPDPLSKSMPELMSQFHCEGVLDWSQVPSSVLAHTYLQMIVTSGVGQEAMLHEGDGDWLHALHRDTLWDWTLRGAKHLFHSKVDTFLVGCVGRKRVVLLPPSSLPSRYPCSAEVAEQRCDSAFQALLKKTRDEGWPALEQYALDAGGDAFTVCPGTYCHIPAGWWHIVRPLDDLTAVLSPSFLRGCWAQVNLNS